MAAKDFSASKISSNEIKRTLLRPEKRLRDETPPPGSTSRTIRQTLRQSTSGNGINSEALDSNVVLEVDGIDSGDGTLTNLPLTINKGRRREDSD